jgi:hypothetical protein
MPDVARIAEWVGLPSLPLFIVWDLARPDRVEAPQRLAA